MRYSLTEQEVAAAKAVAQQVMIANMGDLPTKTLPANRYISVPRTFTDVSGESEKLAQILSSLLGIEIVGGKVVGHDDVKVSMEELGDRADVTLRSTQGDILSLGWAFGTARAEPHLSYLGHEVNPAVREEGWDGDCFPTQRRK